MTTPTAARSYRDVFAGLLFIVIAGAFALEGSNYPMGTLRQMGPGYVPISLAAILAALGTVIAAVGFLRPEAAAEPSPVPWRGIAMVVVSIIVFGSLVNRLGLVPCVFLVGVLMSLASPSNGILSALLIGAALSALSFVIFKEGLGLAIPTFGPLVSDFTHLFDAAPAVAPSAPAPAPAPVAPAAAPATTPNG